MIAQVKQATSQQHHPLPSYGVWSRSHEQTWNSVHVSANGQFTTYDSLDDYVPDPQPMCGQIRTYDSLDEFSVAPQPELGQVGTCDGADEFRSTSQCKPGPVPAVQTVRLQPKSCDVFDDLDVLSLDPQAALCCDSLRVVSNSPDDLGNVTSKDELFSSTWHTYRTLSDKTNSMTSQTSDQAPHVMNNSSADSMNLFSTSTPPYQSGIFLDEDEACHQSKEQSSYGDGHPFSGACAVPRRMTMPTACSHAFGKTAAVDPAVTTMMIQNLPRRCLPAMVAAEIDKSGFAGIYDFLYVPTVFKSTDDGKNFAFVNFINAEVGQAFREEWKRTWRFQSIGQATRVHVVPARIQGRQANISKWGERDLVRVKNPEFKPLMFNKSGNE